MTTSLPTLLSILPLSLCIALTGILLPILLSFLLNPLFSFPLLHAFSAGAALSSTSLGTTLAVLASPTIGVDLKKSKLGTALLGAAVMDDVVAFIFSKILSNIGENSAQSPAALGGQIGRSVGVTFGLGLISLPLTRYLLIPLYKTYSKTKYRTQFGQAGVLFFQACVWIGMVAAAGFAGTSPLYGSYLAGLMVTYVDVKDKESVVRNTGKDADLEGGDGEEEAVGTTAADAEMSGVAGKGHIAGNTINETTGNQSHLQRHTRFGGSPLDPQPRSPSTRRAFERSSGVPLAQTISLPQPVQTSRVQHRVSFGWTGTMESGVVPLFSPGGTGRHSARNVSRTGSIDGEEIEIDAGTEARSLPTLLVTFEHLISPLLNLLLLPLFFGSIGYSIPFIPLWHGNVIWKGLIYTLMMLIAKAVCGVWIIIWRVEGKASVGLRDRARRCWRGALLLGLAMVARGEIGLL